jgi:hydroxymethylglutaryl-CoA lyase
MTSLPNRVTIVEVGPRDGLQNESESVATATKIELINRLSAAGLREVEATSFVNPKAVPQLADGALVMAGISHSESVAYPVLVPNMRGYEAARAAGATHVSVFTAASEGFAQANINASIAESVARFEPIVAAAKSDGVHVRGYVSTAFGCPFDGAVEPAAVTDLTRQLLDIGIKDISIGDTIGVAVPADMAPVITPLQELDGIERLALHLHDTRGTALANTWAALQLGIDTFDASIGGLGGCPFAPGASGNVATEDLVWMLERCGIDTGVDLPMLIETAQWITEMLGRDLPAHIARAKLWI